MRATIFAALAAAALVWPAVAASSAVRPLGTWMFEGEPTRSPRAGHERGGVAKVTLPDNVGLKYLWWEEDADRPCVIVAAGRNINNSAVNATDGASHCMAFNPNPLAGTDGYTVGWPDYSNDVYISAIRLCMNRDGDRMKGIQLRGRVLRSDGSLVAADNEPKAELTNCHSWTAWSSCASGQIAVGLYAYFEPRDPPRAIWAVQLNCRPVSYNASGGKTPFRLTGPITETATAGEETQNGVVLRFDTSNNFGLDTIVWSEKQDRPCRILMNGRDLNDRDRRGGTAERDECGGNSSDRSERSATTREEDQNVFISGVSVCLNNRRLKGVDTEFVRLALPEERAPRPERGVGSGDSQVNCFMGGMYWTEMQRCPERQIGVGIRAFFHLGDEPGTIRGIRLLCRAYEPGR